MSEQPSQPSGFLTPRVIRVLIFAIILMTGFIIAGLIALVWGIKTKLEQAELSPPIALDMAITLEADEVMSAYQISDDGIWLQVDKADGSKHILHFDADGVMTRKVSIK